MFLQPAISPTRPRNPGDTVHSVFAARVRQAPEAIAVQFQDSTLTYRELDARSNALARTLIEAGAKPGDVIAVMLSRSADGLVALLGILKSGAAFLPLDEAYPEDRLRFMLEDCGTTLLVTDRARATLPVVQGARAVFIDDFRAVSAQDGAPIEPLGAGRDLAYVMFTSGSTGKPKGVEIPHAAILRLVCPASFARADASVAFLHAAPLSFDASTLEIWGPLLNGGRCVVHDEVVPSGAGLALTLQRHGVTSAWLTAALFNAIVDDNPANLAGLKQLLIGGEALSVPHVRRAYEALPGVEIINGYGPTETTTFATTHSIPRSLAADAPSVPIGRPISETTLYILSPEMKPVAAGESGELFIGGNGLARGYRHRPELTAERFITYTPPEGAAVRLYRTGDLVRVNAEGAVEFLGRADQQVKIRGYRIELGEIESALAQHASVRSCAVLAREDRPGDKRLVAYVVLASPDAGLAPIQAHLADRLPEFMQPSAYVVLPAMPITPNGKLDRKALPAPAMHRPELANEFRAPTNERQQRVCEIFATVLGLDRVGILDNFFELGGNSLLALRAIAAVKSFSSRTISSTTFFQNPTPEAVAAEVSDAPAAPARQSRVTRGLAGAAALEPVAIVGMAGRFPGADDVDTLWKNLCEGRETLTFFRDEELDASIPASLRGDSSYVKARGILKDVELFDAAFFGISPKEAELMDPQQRKFLEISWECLEHAGYVPEQYAGRIGVFGGMYNPTYFQKHVMHRPDLIEKVGEFTVMLANEKDYVTTRVAHRLNLTGPAVSIHTACSTSLVAVSQAFDSLRNGHCDMAIAGGVAITCPPNSGYLYQEGAMLSPDGHTRSFDSEAQGTVFSDGAAVVLLKRLADAIADGDTIYGVLRGTAINNDGSRKASFTAPSADAQELVVASAQDAAGVDPRDVSYIEAHGTATPLGDPIELEALTRAFRRHTPESGFCRLGSVKSNFGHLVIAAGATGLIKTALALKRQVIPPSLHFKKPNARVDLASTPFVVNDALSEWKPNGKKRIAGVSSFGVGGTNAHVVVEEPPLEPARAAALAGEQLIPLSARSPAALARSVERLGAYLGQPAAAELRDVAHTLRVGRAPFGHRAFVVAQTLEDAAAALASKDPTRLVTRSTRSRVPDVVFMFTGQGAQYPGMGRALYDISETFRAAFDACADALASRVNLDIRRYIFDGSAEELTDTSIAQPATFTIEYALAQFWMARGVKPAALVGHSVGEFVAAVLAGVMSLEEAVVLVAKRGALMQAQPRGSMLSVRAPAAKVAPLLPQGVSIAAENSPQITVVAGPTSDITAFSATLEAQGIVSRTLQTSHAFHSSMMEPVVAPFEAEVRRIRLAPPTLPIVSTLTGTWLEASEATDPAYWARHLREPVKFSPAVRLLGSKTDRVLLEVGPRPVLSTLARQHFTPKDPRPEICSSFGETQDVECRAVLGALGTLWACGLDIDTRPLRAESALRRVPLPTYPFEGKRFWVDAPPAAQPAALAAPPAAPAAPSQPAVIAVPTAAPPVQVAIQPIHMELPMPAANPSSASAPRREQLIGRLRTVFEDVAGVDLADAEPAAPFMELGLDSLALTQVALQLQKNFGVKVTFRQLMETYQSLDLLATHLDASMPPDAAAPAAAAAPAPVANVAPTAPAGVVAMPAPTFVPPQFAADPNAAAAAGPFVRTVIEQQMALMAQQLALLGAAGPAAFAAPAQPAPAAAYAAPVAPPPAAVAQAPVAAAPVQPAAAASAAQPEEDPTHKTYDVKKAFGAIARIHTKSSNELNDRQKVRLETFMRRYIARTQKSKDYTVQHRPHLADPRVVNGFRPQLKEIIYQIVIERSKGARLWDLDGNEYIDALNGFGMSLFGWQPDWILDRVKKQIDLGYDIGPQHPLAGDVARKVCEMTGFDRAGLCNTGSEAVMGALRIARTVTGRTKIALFTGAYHGIFDEVIVRGTKKLRAVPAAPGIMPNTSENVLVLDYGTPESLEILRKNADELAAVLIEPVQSRRPDFQPVEFLKELREITRKSGTLFIFDEVVTGFRSHPRGAQHVLGIDADLASYGKVVGGGFPIGVIAGKREYMDALDGGAWQYGDDSIPTVGVTYFAGTFVRHPLALAAADAVLDHMKAAGPALQEQLTARTTAMVKDINEFCTEVGAPIVVKNFSSVWKTNFTEDHPLQDLLFAMMRSRGIHILDNFPCFFTTAHTEADFAAIANAFKESVRELQEADFLPRRATSPRVVFDASRPPVPGARLGRDSDGKPAWFVSSPDNPGKFLKVN